MKDEVNQLEIELKKLEIEEKKKSLNRKEYRISPIFLGILTVIISVFGSFLTTKLQIKSSNEEFSTELINEIISNDVLISKRKIEFLHNSGLLKLNNDSILKAMHILSIASAPSYYETGYNLMTSKKYKESVIQLKAAIELNPDYTDAYNALAYCYYIIGTEENSLIVQHKGLKAIEKAVQLDSSNMHSLYWKGRILLTLRELDDAKAAFEFIINHNHDKKLELYVESLFFLAETLRLKKENDFCKLYQQAFQLGSKNAEKYIKLYCD